MSAEINSIEDPRQLVMTEMMPPQAANFSGHVHGGYLMMLLDRVAYACAARYTSQYAVTVSVDQILFKEAIEVGELVTFYASVNFVGKTSLEIGIKVVSENIQKKSVRHTNTCYITMVSIDDKTGKPQAVPPLEIRNEIERHRFEEGKLRRQMRFDYQAQHLAQKIATRSKN